MTTTRFDVFAREREAAEVVEPYGVKVLRTEGAVSKKPAVMIFRPKGSKPEVNFSFRTVEAREAYVARYLSSYAASEEAKASYRAERKAVASNASKVSVGTIFCHSWGWEQTNVDYYEVVKVSASGAQVEVKPIACAEVPGSQGQMSAKVKPVPGAFVTKTYRMQDAHGNYKTSLRKRVQYTDRGDAYLSFEYGWCGVVKPEASHYSSWYA